MSAEKTTRINMDKLLIINADDFGLSHGINMGVVRCFRSGGIQGVSLCSVGFAFEEAVSLIKENPGLNVGVHVILTDEVPVSHPGMIKSLLDKSERFSSLPVLLTRNMLGLISEKEVEYEVRKQITRIVESGIRVSHIDGHNHVHIFPMVLRIITKLCKEFNINYIRYPDEGLLPLHKLRFRNFRRLLYYSILKLLMINARSEILRNDLVPVPSFGFLNSGNFCLKDLSARIKLLKRIGINELMIHPGESDEELQKKYGKWKYNWERELALFEGDQFKKILSNNSVRVSSFYQTLEQNA